MEGPCSQEPKIINHINTQSDEDTSIWSSFCDDSLMQQLLEEPFEFDLNVSGLRTDEKYVGFDNETGTTWIYPKSLNLPIRQYQFNITRMSLFQNTLVVLPTGLGKTFIAAVVMYNIYRWYPQGKIIFMAPTRPLVTQQIEACSKIMGIPSKDTAEMTGKQNKTLRQTLWRTKRVFFATPQVVQADISDDKQNFPVNDIKLIVIDEAHKAKGRYAYSEVVKAVHNRNPYFRVLALSATPGHRIEDVAEVIKNLYISHMEIRWDNSIDVVPYIHKRNVKTIVVPLDKKLTDLRNELTDIIDPYIRNLIDGGVLHGSLTNINRNFLLMEQRRFREMSLHQRHPKQASISTDFSISISLSHALELLERHGLWVFLNYFEEEDKKSEKFFVALNPKIRNFLEKLRKNVGKNPFQVSYEIESDQYVKDLNFGHPKFEIAKKVLLEHIKTHNDSRVIIFCEFRDSVRLLYRLLLQSRPLIRPKCFVGQGGTGSVTQKQQLQIMKDFRSGTINTIIATSVAEEGIDVGEVDLIICFDMNSKNPTRFIQRIGRTGRRKQGNVILLATEGKEQSLVKEVLASKDKANRSISKSKNIQHCLYKLAPRLVPPEFNPTCLQTFIQIENEKNDVVNSKTINDKDGVAIDHLKKGRKAKLPEVGSQDVRKFFKKIDKTKNDKKIVEQKSNTPPSKNNSSSICVENLEIVSLNNNIEKNAGNPELIKLIRKFNSIHRQLNNPPKYKPCLGPEEILKSKSHSKLVKRFILEQNYQFVKDKFDGMQAILVVGDDNSSNTVSSNEEKKLQKEYIAIENIFGGSCELERFLNKMESLPCPPKDICLNENSKIFDGLIERELCDDNYDYIASKLEDIKVYFPTTTNKSIILEESNLEISDFSQSLINNEPTESKYMDQWTQFKSENIRNQSTPLSKLCYKYRQLEMEKSPNPEEKKISEKLDFAEDNLSKFFESTFKMETSKETLIEPNHTVLENSPIKENQCDVDLFDDDFDEIFEANTDIFNQIEMPNSCKNVEVNISLKAFNNENCVEEAFKKSPQTYQNKRNFIESSCSTVTNNDLPDIVIEQKRLKSTTKVNVTNPALEDFDFNDFVEPFDEETEKNGTDDLPTNNLNRIQRAASVDLFESPIKAIPWPEIFNSPNKHTTKPQMNEISPSVFGKKPISLRSKFDRLGFEKTNKESSLPNDKAITLTSNESLIVEKNSFRSGIRRRNLQSILSSSNSESDIETKPNLVNTSECSEDEDEVLPASQDISICQSRRLLACRRYKRLRNCEFIDNEAAHSDEDDDLGESENNTASQYVLDSIVVLEEEEDDPSVNMRAKYLQSIRSPVNKPGTFKIPARRQYNDYSRIFSQFVPEDHIDSYREEGDSFVVSDEEQPIDDEVSKLCPLEEAEKILKERRRVKRKAKNSEEYLKSHATKKKKFNRILLVSSDDEN